MKYRTLAQYFCLTMWLSFLFYYSNAQEPTPFIRDAYPTTVGMNYIRSYDALAPFTNPSDLTSGTVREVRQTTQYLDGLGRPLQTVVKQGSLVTGSNPVDLVTANVYDEFGREIYKFLPFPSTPASTGAVVTDDGNFKFNPLQQQRTFFESASSPIYGQGESYYYNKTDFEASPLNRILKSYAAGNSWVRDGRGTGLKYWTNADADNVKIWNTTNVDGSFGSYEVIGSYSAGELYKTVTEDENGKQVIEFKDKEGKVILKKVQLLDNVNGAAVKDDGSGRGYEGWLCTYYIYDDLGQLRCVIQPEGVKTLADPAHNWDLSYNNGVLLNEQCFRYEYDERGRMIMKKVPGAGTVNIIYDVRDRLVFTQDANMQPKNWWLTNIYDDLNRVIATAMMTYSGTLSDLRTFTSDPANLNAINTISVQGSSFPVDISIHTLDPAKTLYQASGSIDVTDGFATNSTTELTMEITNGSEPPSSLIATGNAVPATASFNLLTLTYYDDYTNTQKAYNSSNNSKLTAGNNLYAETLPSTSSSMTKGIVTSTKVWVMEDANDLSKGRWQETASFYDDKGRVVQVQGDNYTGGKEEITNLYDFSGKVLCTYQVHNNPLGDISAMKIRTSMEYDALGRLLSIQKQANDNMFTTKTIVENQYNALGQLNQKTIGGSLETLAYDYNIRGWLLGMNKDFITNSSSSKKFGFALAYDKPTPVISSQNYTAQYNGNIAGTIWKSAGDKEIRRYDFSYDNVNRLLSADFNQLTGSTFDKTAQLDFSVSNLSYDANGNILTQKQRGWKPGGSIDMDDMLYQYKPNSNQLLSVTEGNAINTTDNKLGDFTDKNRTNDDYDYDVNGNLKLDKNKSISSITYNYLNLPFAITTDKGTITYTYDALGNKIEKKVHDLTNTQKPDKTTDYMGIFNYEDNELQFITHEEGRFRYAPERQVTEPCSSCIDYVNTVVYAEQLNSDYFIKDHLGNIRMVLTDEQKQDAYPMATMETGNAATENALYSNIDATGFSVSSISGYPLDNTTFPNQYASKVNGSGNKIGSAIILKVMAGDKFNIKVSSWYLNTNKNGFPDNTLGTPVSVLTDLISALTNSIPAASHGTISQTDMNKISSQIQSNAQNFLNTQSSYDNQRPKAFVNWILFDERMQFVESSSGFEQVPSETEYENHTLEAKVYQHIKTQLPIDKNGYLYIYVSNETPNIDVFFDNLQVTHIRGSILSEEAFYPFGLTMQGISSKAVAFGNPENKKKFVGQEFDDDLGWDTYQFRFRTHDPQIGRFLQIDPLADKYVYNSTYAYAENKPINGIDLEGKEWLGMFFAENNSVITRGPLLEEAVKTTTETSAKTPKIEEHHIIPRTLGDNPLMETAKKGGFELEKSPGENTMPLEKYSKATGEGQHGNAPRYTAEVLKRIAEFQEKNPKATPEQAAQFARNLVKNLKEEINNNPTTKLNDLYKGIIAPQKTDNTGKAPMIRVDQVKPKPEKPFLIPVTPA